MRYTRGRVISIVISVKYCMNPSPTFKPINYTLLLLALASGDNEAIAEGCEWVRSFDQLSAERRRIYRCVETLHTLDDDERYAPALHSLFGAETLATATALLEGELRFLGQPSLGMNLAGCDMHQQLLLAYGKLHKEAQPA